MTHTRTLFGTMPNGDEIFKYTLVNTQGASFNIINYGAIVQSLMVPDRNGQLADVVLGCDTLDGYLHNNPYLGAIVGRYGNRIHNGKFELNGQSIQLAQNDGAQHLHGGPVGFDKKVWELEPFETDQGTGVLAKLESPDGEENYPGAVQLEVRIMLTNNNELQFDYIGTSDQTTLLNPTHHSYFNLSGNLGSSIENHTLQINASAYTPVDSALIPLGPIEEVDNTPMDFRAPTRIGDNLAKENDQLRHGGGIDHNFVLNDYQPSQRRKVAYLAEATSGRTMEVVTDQPGLQIYTGNNLNGAVIGKENIAYGHRCGICLEAQHYPDSPNRPEFPSTVLSPNETYRQFTAYRFGAI
ncbi:MAG: galactose mutarotase [Deltaproteobacteria bacterium]|nr:galactose mutarotase [Deltaproteobacteria bacterium]